MRGLDISVIKNLVSTIYAREIKWVTKSAVLNIV